MRPEKPPQEKTDNQWIPALGPYGKGPAELDLEEAYKKLERINSAPRINFTYEIESKRGSDTHKLSVEVSCRDGEMADVVALINQAWMDRNEPPGHPE